MRTFKAIAAIAIPLTLPSLALAHPGHSENGLVDGLQHPLTGVDHVLALVAVGLLAARMTGVARWLLPALFIAGNVVGGLIAGTGHHLPLMEYFIVSSVLVGGLLLIPTSVPNRVVIGAMAMFGIAHGCAHIQEAAGPLGSYVAGLAISSLLVMALAMAVGLLMGQMDKAKGQVIFDRLAGVSIALGAVALMLI